MKSKYLSNVNIQGTANGPLGSQKIDIQNAQIIYHDSSMPEQVDTNRINLDTDQYLSVPTKDKYGNYDYEPCTKCGAKGVPITLAYSYIKHRRICNKCLVAVLDKILDLDLFKEERLQEALFTEPKK